MGWSAWYTALPISRNFWEVVTTIIITITNMDTNTNTNTSTPTSTSTPTNTSTPTSMNTPPSQPQRKPPKPVPSTMVAVCSPNLNSMLASTDQDNGNSTVTSTS